MIRLQNIDFRYKEKPVLSNFSHTFPERKITGLLGSSGSGKTSILRLIAGLEIPNKGEIIIDNQLVSKEDSLQIPPYKRGVGFVFQDLSLWPHFTVYQNIAFGLEAQKKQNIPAKVDEILQFFGIIEQKEKYPHQLSGGQQQLVAIARSLVLKPRVLLMDEPLANLDVKRKLKLLDYIEKLRDTFDISIIYVTHDHREAFAIADEILVLHNGTVEDSGSVQDIRSSQNEYVQYFLEF